MRPILCGSGGAACSPCPQAIPTMQPIPAINKVAADKVTFFTVNALLCCAGSDPGPIVPPEGSSPRLRDSCDDPLGKPYAILAAYFAHCAILVKTRVDGAIVGSPILTRSASEGVKRFKLRHALAGASG